MQDFVHQQYDGLCCFSSESSTENIHVSQGFDAKNWSVCSSLPVTRLAAVRSAGVITAGAALDATSYQKHKERHQKA